MSVTTDTNDYGRPGEFDATRTIADEIDLSAKIQALIPSIDKKVGVQLSFVDPGGVITFAPTNQLLTQVKLTDCAHLLSKAMKYFYGTHKSSLVPKLDPSSLFTGLAVATFFIEPEQEISSGRWYRSVIVKSRPENQAWDVYFVDHGNCVSVALSDMRPLHSSVIQWPINLINIFVANTERFLEQELNDSFCDQMFHYLQQNSDSDLKFDIEITSFQPFYFHDRWVKYWPGRIFKHNSHLELTPQLKKIIVNCSAVSIPALEIQGSNSHRDSVPSNSPIQMPEGRNWTEYELNGIKLRKMVNAVKSRAQENAPTIQTRAIVVEMWFDPESGSNMGRLRLIAELSTVPKLCVFDDSTKIGLEIASDDGTKTICVKYMSNYVTAGQIYNVEMMLGEDVGIIKSMYNDENGAISTFEEVPCEQILAVIHEITPDFVLALVPQDTKPYLVYIPVDAFATFPFQNGIAELGKLPGWVKKGCTIIASVMKYASDCFPACIISIGVQFMGLTVVKCESHDKNSHTHVQKNVLMRVIKHKNDGKGILLETPPNCIEERKTAFLPRALAESSLKLNEGCDLKVELPKYTLLKVCVAVRIPNQLSRVPFVVFSVRFSKQTPLAIQNPILVDEEPQPKIRPPETEILPAPLPLEIKQDQIPRLQKEIQRFHHEIEPEICDIKMRPARFQ